MSDLDANIKVNSNGASYWKDLHGKAARECSGWRALAEGRSLLLAAYRVGKQPSEKAFRLIDKARKILGAGVVP